MKKIGLVPNQIKDRGYHYTKRLISHCVQNGHTPQITEEIGIATGFLEYAVTEQVLFQQSDFIISLGGDGTLLGVGRKASYYNVPILGINLGTLGFLTTAEKESSEVAVDEVLSGQYTLEKRMLLQAKLEGKAEESIALNDICITRAGVSTILEIRIYVNDLYMDTLRADGVIVYTPTGSTAYNLSAGGPILQANGNMIGITPIAAHTLTSRPFVLSAEDVIKLEVYSDKGASYNLTADGQEHLLLEDRTIIEITKAKNHVSIMKTKEQNFYDVLRQKLSR